MSKTTSPSITPTMEQPLIPASTSDMAYPNSDEPAIPTVVASTCGHRLTGGDPPTETDPILAVSITHCASCEPYIATACHHPVPGTTTHIYGPNDHTLCMECTEFINLSNHLQAVRSKHEAFVSQPSPKEPSLEFDMHRSECRTLVKECNRAGIAYANAATYHLENDDPKLPIVNEHGTRLLPSTKLSGALATGVQGKDAIPKRVTFDETLEHPTRETSRDVSRAVLAFRRRTAAYVPGKYAEPEEGSWVNTCNPQLNDWREVDGLQSKEAMEPKREAPKAPKSTQQEGEEDPETGVHDARLDQDIEQVKLSMKTLSEDDSAGGGDQSTVLVQDADLAEFVDFVSSMLDPDELKQFEEDWMAEDHGDEDKDAGEEAQTAENAYQSDKESNDDASSPDEDDGPYQSDTGLSGSETIIASLKRSRDDEDEGWTLGDDHPDEERNRVFAIRLLTPDAARSRITYKTNGFTLPESEK